jgi:hypothetical protein
MVFKKDTVREQLDLKFVVMQLLLGIHKMLMTFGTDPEQISRAIRALHEMLYPYADEKYKAAFSTRYKDFVNGSKRYTRRNIHFELEHWMAVYSDIQFLMKRMGLGFEQESEEEVFWEIQER